MRGAASPTSVASLREAIGDAIESLLLLLDLLDDDPDFEPEPVEGDGDEQDYDTVVFS